MQQGGARTARRGRQGVHVAAARLRVRAALPEQHHSAPDSAPDSAPSPPAPRRRLPLPSRRPTAGPRGSLEPPRGRCRHCGPPPCSAGQGWVGLCGPPARRSSCRAAQASRAQGAGITQHAAMSAHGAWQSGKTPDTWLTNHQSPRACCPRGPRGAAPHPSPPPCPAHAPRPQTQPCPAAGRQGQAGAGRQGCSGGPSVARA